MIVIGVDVHKHSLTAAAVDELGRALAEHSGTVGARWRRGRARWETIACGQSRTVGTAGGAGARDCDTPRRPHPLLPPRLSQTAAAPPHLQVLLEEAHGVGNAVCHDIDSTERIAINLP